MTYDEIQIGEIYFAQCGQPAIVKVVTLVNYGDSGFVGGVRTETLWLKPKVKISSYMLWDVDRLKRLATPAERKLFLIKTQLI